MQTDRTTKLLLGAIAVALWGHLLMPLFTPRPAEAQRDLVADVNIARIGGHNVNGNLGLPVYGGAPGSRPITIQGAPAGTQASPVLTRPDR